ncbi:hypothetical protein D3C87_1290600 [compost metagenome]
MRAHGGVRRLDRVLALQRQGAVGQRSPVDLARRGVVDRDGDGVGQADCLQRLPERRGGLHEHRGRFDQFTQVEQAREFLALQRIGRRHRRGRNAHVLRRRGEHRLLQRVAREDHQRLALREPHLEQPGGHRQHAAVELGPGQGAPAVRTAALAERGLVAARGGPARHEAAEAQLGHAHGRVHGPHQQRPVGAPFVRDRGARHAGIAVRRIGGDRWRERCGGRQVAHGGVSWTCVSPSMPTPGAQATYPQWRVWGFPGHLHAVSRDVMWPLANPGSDLVVAAHDACARGPEIPPCLPRVHAAGLHREKHV